MIENKLDKTIENLCTYLNKKTENTDVDNEKEVSEVTNALAALVTARALFD